jgi:hypothetical protein
MGANDSWSYGGEVEKKPPGLSACLYGPCKRVCDSEYCAHGNGIYSTDGGESYRGTFRHGLMHGSGSYSSDSCEYEGTFTNGRFDGRGTGDCTR